MQSCPTLCDPMIRSTPGLPVNHQLPEFTQTHVHWVSDAIQPSHPLEMLFPVLTVASWPAYRFLKRQVRWSGIPISFRIFHSLLWSTQSKALHSQWRTDSLEKTLMLGKIEGRRKRDQQRMRWLDGIIESMDMGLVDSGSWWWTGRPAIHGVTRIGRGLATEQQKQCTGFNGRTEFQF